MDLAMSSATQVSLVSHSKLIRIKYNVCLVKTGYV